MRQCGHQVVSSGMTFLENYRQAKHVSSDLQVLLVCEWAPPLSGVIKVNTDGAIFEVHGGIGVSMVERDCRGQVVGWLLRMILQRPPLLLL
ncbi:UNVERIFIED_CONTAM: hypothetical protein Sradi_6244100 [Sesamum radiatum]|uniref:RNase H type-1 domain-containing protein n=1 Tax=Sesamum radiatum TaxID=300843 RepID=A0AAW2KD98_SESRA